MKNEAEETSPSWAIEFNLYTLGSSVPVMTAQGATGEIQGLKNAEIHFQGLELRNAIQWSAEAPHLYQLIVSLKTAFL